MTRLAALVPVTGLTASAWALLSNHAHPLAAGESLVTSSPTHFRNIPGSTVDTY
ncbi:MAG: hypothetical protein WCI75_02780 [candidate division NC10 bacterium]